MAEGTAAIRERMRGNGRTAVVTGAAGFLGREFVRQLTGLGWSVRGVDRVSPGDVGCEIVVGDISNAGRWTDALAGADLVVHTAAIVAEAGDRAQFHRVNVVGTRNVITACERHGVGRLLHVSSIVVYGRDFPDEVTEDAPLQPSGNPYTDTKIAAELEVLRGVARGSLDITVIRPGDVYGPGSRPWTIRPVELMKRKLFVLVDGGLGVLSPVFIEDVADGGILAAVHSDAIGQAYNITGGHGMLAKDFFEPYARATKWMPLSLPAGVVAAGATLIGWTSTARRRPSPISREAIEYVTHPGTYSAERARTELGWFAGTPFSEGMARTLEWLVAEGYVSSERAKGRLWE